MFDNPLPTLLALSLIALVAALVTVIRALAQRERAEEARHLAAALVDAEPAPRLLCGRDGRVLHANAAARALLGDAPPLVALAGRLIDDDTAHDGIARLRAAAEAGVPERVDLPLVPADGPAGPLAAGSPEWWQVSLRPVRGGGDRGGGALAGAMAWTLEDVTARRVIDDILIREREDLAEFLYLMPVGLYSADAEGRLRFVNQRLAEWLGVTPEDLAGRTLDDVLDGGSAPTETEGAWRGEVTFTARSGRTFPALILQNTYDDAGETRTRSVVVRDALGSAGGDADAASTAGGDGRFRWLFDGAPVGLCLLDLEGVITDCNPAFCRIAGQSRPDLIDRPLKDILASEDVGDLDVLMHRVALGAEDSAHREVRLAHDPDSAAALYIAPMGSGAGVDALVAHFIDTTARRTLEAQFAQAQKMQAMGQLAGGVAHDFNNLLTAMIGFCDLLLQRHGAGDPSFSDIMQIQQNANRAANLVRQLLAFSRKQPLAPRLLDVTDALTEMHHLLRRLLGERVRLDMKHGRDVGMVRVDPGQFDQVIINLAVNARDAMADKGPGREGEDSRLEVRTRSVRVEAPFTRGPEHVPAGDYAVITVADTGSGIPRENLGRIFEPFFSTKTGSVGTGTGLGLSTVYGIIRQTGGFIFVDSTVGKGTEFTIYLPRHVGAEAAPTAPRPAAAKPADAADLTGGGRILLVEDEDPVRIFAARALRNKGYTVIEARTAEGALEILDEQPHLDVLITDMVMPGMNGAELARVVRRDRPDLPVILISGYSEEAARGEITDSADMHFLPKPFSLQQLAEKVKDVTTAAPA
ncbi:PAS domain-containing protein [Novispirillum sp. DQ9]|uniref:hybrid sensor histidine kinase/response regulator n=1 Tax=Novispirillum sp. DQ9 TaxID=3398612 RepID=UPI003C7E78EB